MKRPWLLGALLLLSCRGDKTEAKAELPLDVPLAAGQARAGKVTRARELIGGPVAYGRPGDVWKLYNRDVRFLVQDVGAATGLDLYGGNLIDADKVREGDDGTNGRDLFRETFPLVGLHAFKPEKIEVVSDGQKGGPAILRLTGSDAATDILPPLDGIALDLGGAVTVEYELAPDVPYLKITTTYRAAPGQSLATLTLGDFLSFGASLTLLSPENGFTGKAVKVSFLATTGDGVSYGYVYPEGDLEIPLVDASGTVTLLKSEALPKDGSLAVTRYLVVGDGDAASVSGAAYALRKQATVPIEGMVTDGGKPVAGARVTLFRAPYGADSHCLDQAKTDAAGRFRFAVPPGSYVAVAGGIGRRRSAPAPVSLAAPGAKLDLPLGAPGRVAFDINVPAKISFQSVDVERPDSRFGPDPTESENHGLHGVALSADGKGALLLKPGTYRATVSRGPEYELVTIDQLVVRAGETTPLQASLTRVVDTTGWLAGDYHQHCQGSIDSPVSIRERVIENMAEGIELPAATDHDNTTDYRPHIKALGGEAWINALVGNEVSVNGVGHFNAYPIAVDAADPYRKVGAKFWARRSIRELAALVHREPAPVVFHVSHPRTKSLSGWFNSVKFDPTTGQAALDFPIAELTAVEVNGDLGDPASFLAANDAAIHKRAVAAAPSGIPALRDWFAFLNLGHKIAALGNSDTHGRNDGTGWPRSFVFLGTDDPRAATGEKLVAAIKAQQVSVSHGPFVTAALRDKTLAVKIQAASWIDVATIELYSNGRPLGLARLGPGRLSEKEGAPLTLALDPTDAKGKVVRFDGTIALTGARDAWYVVVVRGQRSMAPVAGGAPYAYTNPLYLDVGQDGWTPPGLP